MAQINNTTSYPEATAPLSSDSILIGSLASGVTNNFQLSDIATYVMGANTLTLQDVCDNGTATTTGITVAGTTTLNGALDANSTADIADTLTLSKATGTGLAVTADATVGGVAYLSRLSVSSVSAFSFVDVSAAFTSSSTADIADTLTLSKATGTGLDVVADASIGGTLTMGIGDGVVTNQITAPPLSNIAFYMGGVQRGAFVAPSGSFVLGYGLTVTSGTTILQDALFQGGLYTTPDTPASASASGTAGQISVDANYIYVCTATNTWKRVAIATW